METDKVRIERQAEGFSHLRVYPKELREAFKRGYIAGATAELQRNKISEGSEVPKEEKKYRNLVLLEQQTLIARYYNNPMTDESRKILNEAIEGLTKILTIWK